MAAKKPAPAQVHDYGSAIYIGVETTAVIEVRAAINDILSARVDNETMRVALQTLGEACKVENVAINNCHFQTGPTEVAA